MATKNSAKFFLHIFTSRISLLLLGALTVWLGVSAAREMHQKNQVNKEIVQLQAEILDLGNKNSDLASLLDSFDDPNTVELEAKRRLNLKKPGEEVAVVLRSPESNGLGRDKNSADKNIVQGGGGILSQDSSNKPGEGKSVWLANPLKWWQYITDTK